jgi:hypothetical protein
MDREFGSVMYTAEDGIWIIYEEPSGSFVSNVSAREKLDSFKAECKPPQSRSATLIFNDQEAKVIFDVDPSDNDWVKHFMVDLNELIRPPSLFQRFGGFPIPLLLVGGAVVIPVKQPYCRIIIKAKPPNQRFLEIGDNIFANLLYDLLKVVLGAILAIVAAWLLKQFGFDIFKLLGITNGS